MLHKIVLSGALMASLLAAADKPGIRPRPAAADYQSEVRIGENTVAAALLSESQVEKEFATDLKGRYYVVEVAVYPQQTGGVDVTPDEFILRVGPNRTVLRPVDAKTIAGVLYRESNKDVQKTKSSDVVVIPSVGVGVGRGPGFDPITGAPRGGVNVGVGVGVGGNTGPAVPPPGSTQEDRRVVQEELQDKALPDGRAAQPVAGYLYFPITSDLRRKAGEFVLEYTGTQPTPKLPLQAKPAGGSRLVQGSL